VPDVAGLRPTPDRVRETLFNWLTPYIDGASCLDCFAGTGALAFEALSRGARRCVLLEQDPGAAQILREHAVQLGAAETEVLCVDARAWLHNQREKFDIIFLDPPFQSALAAETCLHVANGRNLADAGLLYVESAPGWLPPEDHFEVHRQGRAGQVQFMLLTARSREQQ
jgi:16S rRNA (guanine966-N2)-methyltransferase